jgi:hypothetical protein
VVKIMKTKLAILLFLLSGFAALLPARAQAPNPTAPQEMPISIAQPKPPGQKGLRRPQGDGNVWTFVIEPEPGIVWVEGPNWSYPGKGEGADPDWGQWGGGDGQLWLSWVSPQIAAPFTIRMTGKIGKPGGSGGEPIDVEASWEGEVTSFSIAVRRKNSGDEFGGSATVAAGGASGQEHQADVEITAHDSSGSPMAGVSVPAIRISSGGQDATGTLNASVSMTSSTTDANGKATGTFTSGNRVETTTLTIDKDDDPETTEGEASASVNQKWNELEGSEDAWQYEPYYDIGVASPITYIMTFDGGVPITGHNIGFYTYSITGWEWNPYKSVDEDYDGIVDYYGDYDEDITYYEDDPKLKPNGTYAGLVAYGGTSESNGEYTANMTVRDYIGPEGYVDFYTDSVEFGVHDSNSLANSM